MATKRVRDVAAPRRDREVKGSGQFGVAYGGLSGDGDVVLFRTPKSARDAVMDAFIEVLSADAPEGTLVRSGWVDKATARRLMAEVDVDLSGWLDTVDGSCLDIVVEAEVVRPRVGIFRCSFDSIRDKWGNHLRNGWVIPPQVRLPAGERRDARMVDGAG